MKREKTILALQRVLEPLLGPKTGPDGGQETGKTREHPCCIKLQSKH